MNYRTKRKLIGTLLTTVIIIVPFGFFALFTYIALHFLAKVW